MSNFKRKLGEFIRGEKTTSGVLTVIIVLLVLAVNVLLYTLGSYFGLYLYYPVRDDLEISGATDSLFEDVLDSGKRVSIIFCQVRDDVESSSTGSYVLNTAEQFAQRYPELIDIEFVNITVKRKYTADNTFGEYFDPSHYQTVNADGTKNAIVKTSVIFECEDNFKVLSDNYTDGYSSFFTLDSSYKAVSYNGEETIAAMVKWVLTDEHKTAYFTMYHGETYDVGFANLLTCAGYEVDMLDLRTETRIPDDAGLIIISNPRSDFEKGAAGTGIVAELDLLGEYIENGGSLYVALDPFGKPLTLLEEFLSGYGITVSTEKTDSGLQRNIVRDPQSSVSSDYMSVIAKLADGGALSSAVSDTVEKYGTSSVILRSCAALLLSEGAEPLLMAGDSAETYAGSQRTDSSGGYCLAAAATHTSEDGKVGSIFVVPSVYLTATDSLVSGGYANRSFIYSVFENVFGREDLPHGCKTVYYDSETLDGLTMGEARIYTAVIMLVPTVIAAVGAFIVIRRKNR